MEYNIQLTPNFNLNEVIFWADHLIMSQADKDKAARLATDHLTTEVIISACYQANRLQDLRNKLNQIYSEYNVWILVSSWLRPKQWELYKGRDGSSQHTTGLATDIQIKGLPKDLQDKAYQFAMGYFTNLEGFTKRYGWGIHNDSRGCK